MSINMSNVKKIQMPFPATIYKKTFSFENSSVVYRGTSTPCPIDVTLYSTTAPSWTGESDTSTLGFWNYVHDTLGYEETGGRYYLIVDNPYEFEYVYNNQSCVLASCQLRNTAQNGTYFIPWFSVPGAGSVNVGSAYTITAKTGWVLVGNFNEYEFYNNVYLNNTSGSYTYFSASKDILTGEEYITNYCINGVSYPNVTISSVSGDTYYLSDGHSYTPSQYKMTFITFGGLKEVKKIEDNNGNVLWQKPSEGSLKTINAYYIHVYDYSLWLTKEQLTTKVACSSTQANGTKFFLLTLNEFNAIKNGTYSGSTVGHTINEWVYTPSELYWCYFNDNYEIYLVGDSRNSTANDTVLGTTNDPTYAKRYYCFYNNAGYYYVNLIDNSATTSSVTRWRVTRDYYWVNHTNHVSTGNRNCYIFESTTINVQPFYIKYGSYYIKRESTYFVTTSTTASTVWYLDDDNRIYCLDGTTKWYLQWQTSGSRVVCVGTSIGSYVWLYKNGNYITGTNSGTTYYLYRYGSGYDGVRMRTTATTLTFVPVSS